MSCPKGAEGPTPPKVKVNILGPQVFLGTSRRRSYAGGLADVFTLLFLKGSKKYAKRRMMSSKLILVP